MKNQLTPQQLKKRQATNKKVLTFGCLPILVLLAIIIIASIFSEDEPVNYWNADNGGAAYVVSQQMVKQNLKSPSTADFPMLDFNHWRLDSATYVIKGYVDSQNSFGATVRTNYRAKMLFSGDDPIQSGSWTFIEFEME